MHSGTRTDSPIQDVPCGTLSVSKTLGEQVTIAGVLKRVKRNGLLRYDRTDLCEKLTEALDVATNVKKDDGTCGLCVTRAVSYHHPNCHVVNLKWWLYVFQGLKD